MVHETLQNLEEIIEKDTIALTKIQYRNSRTKCGQTYHPRKTLAQSGIIMNSG